MSQGADGDSVHAGCGNLRNGFECDSTGGFQFEATICESNRVAEGLQTHVIEENDVDALELEKITDLIELVGFEDDPGVRMIPVKPMDGGLQLRGRGSRGKMVVFDHHHIVEAHSVVDSPPREHGGLFESSETRDGLASIKDPGARSGDGVDEAAGEGGDAGEVLQEVESDPLGTEQRGQQALDFEDTVTGLKRGAIRSNGGDLSGSIDAAEHFCRGLPSGEDRVFLAEKAGAGRTRFDEILRGQIP